MVSGEKDLLAALADFPNRVQNRLLRHGNKKAGAQIAARTSQNTPRRTPSRGEHLADRMISKQVTYRGKNATTVNIIGGQSGGHNRINHLVEEGTAQRFTAHATKYKRTDEPVLRKRRVKTAQGWRTKMVQERRSTKKSIGSFATGRGVAMNRGRMPAFHQLKRAAEQTPIMDIMEQEIRRGLQRLADRTT